MNHIVTSETAAAIIRLRDGSTYATTKAYDDIAAWIFDEEDLDLSVEARGPYAQEGWQLRTWLVRRSDIVAIRRANELVTE